MARSSIDFEAQYSLMPEHSSILGGSLSDQDQFVFAFVSVFAGAAPAPVSHAFVASQESSPVEVGDESPAMRPVASDATSSTVDANPAALPSAVFNHPDNAFQLSADKVGFSFGYPAPSFIQQEDDQSFQSAVAIFGDGETTNSALQGSIRSVADDWNIGPSHQGPQPHIAGQLSTIETSSVQPVILPLTSTSGVATAVPGNISSGIQSGDIVPTEFAGFHALDADMAAAPQSAPTAHMTTTQAGAQITRGNYHWGSTLGAAAGPITFGFRTSPPGYSDDGEDLPGTFTPFTPQEEAAARSALALWASVANVTFTDLGNTNGATIEFANYYSSTDNSQAFAYYPGRTGASAYEGDVFMNTYYVDTVNIGPGTYDWMTMIHEIGHALGLQHPGDYNAGPGQTITYNNSALYVEDTRQYTLMSYFDESFTGAHHAVYNETPMLHDIAAIQRLYGANTTTFSGDTVFGFNSNAGTPYSIAANSQKVVFTVYDTGGTDTLDFSGYTQTQTINLNAESFSSVGGNTYNVSIAQNVTIENAIGGSGVDMIIGNGANNTIRGGHGNDSLDGAGGTDTAVFSGLYSAYTITRLGGGNTRVVGTDGTDQLAHFEYAQFNDQTVWVGNLAPTAIVADHSQHVGTLSQVQSWVSYSDSDGDASAYYQFVDHTMTAGSGSFWTPSTGYVAAGTILTVAAADLASVYAGGASVVGTDQMYVRAFDGTDWGQWDAFNLNTTNHAPTAAIADQNIVLGAMTPVTNWLSWADADGDMAAYFQFYDAATTAGSARVWTPSGGYLASGAYLQVATADIGNVYIGGASVAGTDQMYVRAFDGYEWGAWDTFNLTSSVNALPTATINDQSLAVNHTARVSNWLTYSDANSDPAAAFQFYDATATAGSASFSTPESGSLASGSYLTVAAAALGTVSIGGAAATGTDQMYVRAFDGHDWGNWDAFNFASVANSAPTAFIANQSMTLNTATQVLNWLSWSDADGDMASYFQFYDATATSGSASFWTPSSGYLASGAYLSVATSDLGGAYVGAGAVSGTDQMYVRAFDGYAWGDWHPFTITSHA